MEFEKKIKEFMTKNFFFRVSDLGALVDHYTINYLRATDEKVVSQALQFHSFHLNYHQHLDLLNYMK